MDEKQIEQAFDAWWATQFFSDDERDAQLVAWLACYQHLAPMVEDAERYRWLRNPNHDIEPVIDQRDEDATIDGIPTVIYEYRSGEELDKAIDAVREQEKKNAE